MKLLIVGHGFVGSAVQYGFSHPEVDITIVDPKYDVHIDDVDVSSFNVVFVCVPTPFGDNGIDSTILDNVMNYLIPKQPQQWPTVIIKSTVTADVLSKYDKTHIVYNPEFLTEKSANEQFINPQFHVFGGNPMTTQIVSKLYQKYSLCNPCPEFHMTMQEASFVKYTINSFLATKVLFFNQIYDAANQAGVDFNTIIKAVGLDNRIGHSHTKVPGFDYKQGYGGACFPKDTSAFTKFSNKLTLLEECIKINNDYRSQYELDNREIEQNVNYGQT